MGGGTEQIREGEKILSPTFRIFTPFPSPFFGGKKGIGRGPLILGAIAIEFGIRMENFTFWLSKKNKTSPIHLCTKTPSFGSVENQLGN